MYRKITTHDANKWVLRIVWKTEQSDKGNVSKDVISNHQYMEI